MAMHPVRSKYRHLHEAEKRRQQSAIACKNKWQERTLNEQIDLVHSREGKSFKELNKLLHLIDLAKAVNLEPASLKMKDASLLHD